VIGERTRHALAAANARGIKLGNPEQAKINWAKAAARAHALRPHIERRIKPGRTSSSAIATDLRHRMAANGFRCRFVRPRSSRPIESKDLIGRITSISPSRRTCADYAVQACRLCVSVRDQSLSFLQGGGFFAQTRFR